MLLAVLWLLLAVPAPSEAASHDLLVSSSPDRSNPAPLDGQTRSGKIYVFTSPAPDVSRVDFYLDNPAFDGGDPTSTSTPRQADRVPPSDFAGTAADGTANPFNTTTHSDGSHTITAVITEESGTTQVVSATFAVDNSQQCSPLQCSDVKVSLPYELDFKRDHGKIADGSGVGTGFTWIDKPTNGPGYIPQNLAVDRATGGLHVTTTKGLFHASTNSQDNALAVGIDAPSQRSTVRTTLVNPPSGTKNYEQAGTWFGTDEDNYSKLVVLSSPRGTRVEHLMEVNGERVSYRDTKVLNLATSKVDLRLKANPFDKTVKASYRVNGGTTTTLGKFSAPGEFFSFDAAGIDPTIGTRSFGGILASHRDGPRPLVYTFDDFSVTDGGAPATGSSQSADFKRSSFALDSPTSMAFGPDGRLYVAEMFGKIHAITLGRDKQPVADEVITTLGNRLTLGITIDPRSTPDNVILWASHSSPSLDDGEPNSSTISRLSGPDFATADDVITGLPRAKANHAVNSIHFGPDDKLYIAAGGNTGAGAPNSANTEFGSMKEQPLSAAVLVADVRDASFDGSCHNSDDIFGPPPCDVVTYATGLRNTYDFVFHSNGSLYAPDNGLGVTGTFPTSPKPPCFGRGDTRSWRDGGENPGEQPDSLNRIRQGKYYGHPNPYRSECVFRDGRYQNASPLPNYVKPMHNLGASRSANGTIEYTSGAFCENLKHDLVIANYSVGDDLTRIKLAADGRSVTDATSMVGGFNNPLPIAQGPDGTIYTGELGANKVTALEPVDRGCWTKKAEMPASVLDAGGTALGGKIYAVAGKTNARHTSKVYAYDTETDTWSTGPELPGPAVENPAVVGHGGKLYAFGGSTGPFSGAVANAAVFDGNTWTPLRRMPTARSGATTQVIDGKIYVVGGMGEDGASLKSVEVYDPAADAWSSAPPMSSRRDNPGSAAIDHKLYIFGGRTRNADGTEVDGTLKTVERYDPATDTWSARRSMPTGRRAMVVGDLNGRAQVIGGERKGDGSAFTENEEYNPATNTWRTLKPVPTPRHGAVAGTLNGVVYVIGGGPSAGSFTNVNEAFSFSD